MRKFVYAFEEGSKEMKGLLGGKGANLAEMKKIGLPVPNGFTITTEACNAYYDAQKVISDEVIAQINEALAKLEAKTGKKLGDPQNPLLVSVRSGAFVSMPGMMDTVLNLGLNEQTVEGLALLTENRRFAMDCYRRFIQMFGDVVLEIPKYKFDKVFDTKKTEMGITEDTALTEADLEAIIVGYKKLVKREKGFGFPEEPTHQLEMAIEAVFGSWNNDRAIVYRNLHEIPHDLGTAVNIQEMVFGNMGESSGTGVAFTRNPSNGDNVLFGEFLMNAQGEDVVAGIRTPHTIAELEKIQPEVFKAFNDVCKTLENHYKDMQDIEFTVERGTLYLLQTRSAKRTAFASVKVAVDMVEEGLITREEALMRIEPAKLDELLHPMFEPHALAVAVHIAKGLPASPGAAFGKIYFHSEDVIKAKNRGETCILVRTETSPEDIEGMVHANGILTSRGGMTSHAAVVARGMGKCCVAGCSALTVDEDERVLHTPNGTYDEGDFISLDGITGNVYQGKIDTTDVAFSDAFNTVLSWADEARNLGVRANADTPKDAKKALEFGASGIGLCRTEHMFFDAERIIDVRRMILSETTEERLTALQSLLVHQQKDFEAIFEVMGAHPVTVRLLDPPLHEFLPVEENDILALSKHLDKSADTIRQTVKTLAEFNPMLGHRGCRLSITFPEIYNMQIKAIARAAILVSERSGVKIEPEIMVPLVGHLKEFELVKEQILKTLQDVMQEMGASLDYKIGTMIEVPRATLISDEIAENAEFFSYGTNDLTQMTLGFSRDDAGKFIGAYVQKGIFEKDPFASLDQRGVGQLVKMSVEKARQTRPEIKLGICGEHGGDPKSIEFFNAVGIDYISCSPFRVPIARLAAAQAAIRNRDQSK
ncbi:pyruvate, phosphate dikinase [Fusibacter sp. JL298sf-3]